MSATPFGSVGAFARAAKADPIARSITGVPLAYATLGAAFHLEALVPADGERLAKACERIAGWIGPNLRWSWSSVHAEVSPFSPADLDLIASFPLQLRDTTGAAGGDARARAGTSALEAAHYDKFGVACHGAEERNVASPFGLRFFATARPDPKPRKSPDGAPLFRSHAMLSFTVPIDTPLDELREQSLAVAKELRLRWGSVGLSYGAWELDRYTETRAAIHAHARRHPGFDVGQHATWMEAFHDRMRTVSWLSLLGPAFAARLRERGDALASDDLVAIAPFGEGVVLRAGVRPEAGDVNRGEVPSAYVWADRRVRAVRAAEDIHFYAPWSSATTEAWLKRFELAEQGVR